jgi:glycerophosphoryl diester phosphodiesterase
MTAITGTTGRRRAPLAIAHRGASVDAPENTIAAFELGLAEGAEGLGIEVHLSRDDHPVVIRDFSLERTTDGAGPVRAHTVRELKRLDCGGWHSRQFRGQRLQTLQEVLERFRDRARFWIELPAGSEVYPDVEERVLSTLEIYEAVDRALVLSPDDRALARLRRSSGEVRLGLVAGSVPAAGSPASGSLEALCPRLDLVTGHAVATIHGAGLACYPWTLSETTDLGRLVDWGIDGIFTDRPGRVRAGLDRVL